MAANLSFLHFKGIFHSESYQQLDDSQYYQFSFNHRRSVELQYKILCATVAVDTLPASYKNHSENFIEAGARFLLRDAEIADNSAEARHYQDKITYLEQRRAGIPASPVAQASGNEWQTAWERLHHDAGYWFAARLHMSRFITLLSYLNLYRLVTVFARFSVKFFWLLAAELQWLDARDRLLGIVPVQRNALDLPAAWLNFLSVFLFVMRLAANIALILKHALSTRPGEVDINPWDRAMRELSTRLGHVMNDVVWLLMNILTNYPAVWGIPAPIANTLVTIALIWDFSCLAIHWYREQQELAMAKAQLQQWQQELVDAPQDSELQLDSGFFSFQLRVLADLQLETTAKYLFMMLAGIAIMGAYYLFLSGISTLVSLIALTVCVAGFAMYGSAEQFAGLMRAYFGQVKISGEIETKQADFFHTYSKILMPPMLAMGLLSLGWQIAILGSVVLLLYSYAPEKWWSHSEEDSPEHAAQFI